MRKKLKKIKSESLEKRYRRKLSTRAKISGSPERPRVCALRSNKHISVLVVDDVSSKTILALNSFGKKGVKDASNSLDGAKVLGQKLAEELKKKGFERVVFDRNGRPYSGVLAALAESIRQGGILI